MLRRELMQVYMSALERGSVISSFPTIKGIDAQVDTEVPQPSAPYDPSPAEARTIVALGQAPKDSSNNGVWVFRRHGYTESENPEHLLSVITTGKAIITMGYHLTALEPIIPEIFNLLNHAVVTLGATAPRMIMVDCFSLIETLETLLRPCGIQVEFYAPPSEMEAHTSTHHPQLSRMQGRSQRATLNLRIPPDTNVVLHGLVGAAHLNGRRGRIVHQVESSENRYLVALSPPEAGVSAAELVQPQSGAERVKVKGGNLLQLLQVHRLSDGTPGWIVGMKSSSEAPEQQSPPAYLVSPGTLPEQQRFSLNVDSAEVWPASNTCLPIGTCVHICGLVSATHLNGRLALITSVDISAGRYTVTYAAAEGVSTGTTETARVRFGNVSL